MTDVILDTLIDGLKLLPFLFFTYIVMEYLEHRTGSRTQGLLKKAGRLGPLFGGVLGAFPQCGFSAAASNFYAGRVITMGTLIAVYLSTSDEMLPVLISEQAPVKTILYIVGGKVLIGIIAGFLVDLLFHSEEHEHIHDLCQQDHCHCENGILKSAIVHTLQIFTFVILISFALNLVLFYLGEDALANLILNKPVIGPVLSGIVGLIPNCAASVVITQLFLKGAMGAGAMMSGLLVGAGVGLLLLFRMNRNLKENLKIVGILYIIGVVAGIGIELVLG